MQHSIPRFTAAAISAAVKVCYFGGIYVFAHSLFRWTAERLSPFHLVVTTTAVLMFVLYWVISLCFIMLDVTQRLQSFKIQPSV